MNDEDDDNTNRFVSTLRVLSSFRKYTSFCLVFLGLFENAFGNYYDNLWNLISSTKFPG